MGGATKKGLKGPGAGPPCRGPCKPSPGGLPGVRPKYPHLNFRDFCYREGYLSPIVLTLSALRAPSIRTSGNSQILNPFEY